jgi:ATP-dependent Clp protease adaptor protein ClpS
VSTIAPERTEEEATDEVADLDTPWVAIVWNDPVNLMAYVQRVFQKLFGHPPEVAHKLMMQVHEEGRAAVTEGTREHIEAAVQRLHEHGLWATVGRA